MTVVSSLVIEMAANVARLQQDMDRARKTVEGATGRMASAANTAMTALKGLGVGLAGVSFTGFISGSAQATKELTQFAYLANATAPEFQKLALAAGRFGVSQEKLADILKDTQDKVGDFMQTGGGAMADFFERVAPRVGVTAEQFRKLSGKDALQLYVSSLEKANLSQSDMVFFMEAIASDSTLLLPLLQDNGKALAELANQADAFGLAMDDGAIRASKELSDRLADLNDFAGGIGQTIYRELLPGLVAVTTALVDWARTSGVAQIAGNAVKVVFQAISVVGSDVIFVITQVSRGLVALAQASGKVLTGDFSGAANVFTEYNAQARVARAALDDMQAKIMGVGQASVATAEVVKTSTATLAAAFTKPTEASKAAAKELAEQRKKDLAFGEYLNKQIEERAKKEAELAKDIIELHKDSIKPFEDSLKALQGRIEGLKDEERAVAMSEAMNISLAEAVERVSLEKLKQLQIDAMGNPDAVANIQRQIDLQKEYIDLVSGQQAREASTKAAKQAADEWKKSSEKIQDSITDALMRGFESGKGFVQNLVDTIKNMFSTMVLRPVVQAVVGSGLSAVGLGGASSASASTLGGLSQSVLGNFAQSAIGTSIISSSAAYGAAIGTTSIGAGSQAAMLAAQTSGFGAAGTLATAQAAGTGSSMMASAAAAGPYVAAALVALNALGALRSKKIVGGGLTGTLGEGTINTYDLQRRGGTLFNGPSYSIQNVRASDQSQAIQDAFLAMRAATAGMAQQLGLANESILSFTTRLGNDLIHPDTGGYGIKLDGLNPEQAAAKVQAALESANEQMARMLLGTFETVTTETGRFFKKTQTVTNWMGGPLVREGETAAQALMRLSSSLSNVNTVLDTLNQRLMDSSLAGADLSSALIDVFGGVDNFRAATGAYYDAIYSQEEKLAKTAQNLTKALAALGMSMPPTIRAYRDLVEAQDLTTATGRDTYAALVQLAPVFAQVANAAEGMATKLGRLVGAAADELTLLADRQIEASQNAAAAARDAAEQFKDAGLMLREAARAILGMTVSAAIDAAASYAQGLAGARGGDLASMQALPELANAMLAEQRSRAATRIEANLAAARTATELNEVAKLAEATGAQKSYQAKLYDVNTAMLEVLRSTLQSGEVTSESMAKQLQALTSINGLISGSVDIQSDTLDVTEIAAIATAGSQALLDAVLGQLRVPDASAEFLNAGILSGNTLVASKIEVLIAAVNKQTADQQAEVRRQQDLLKAQAELESAGVTAENLKAVAAQASQALAQTSRTIEVYLGRGGKLGTGSRRYRYDPNPAYDTATQAALDAEIAVQLQLQELERLRQTIRDLGGIPAFATGGMHTGGIRLVGENGPELEVTGPARIYNAQQTADMLRGASVPAAVQNRTGGQGDPALRQLVADLTREVVNLRAEARAGAMASQDHLQLTRRMTRNGQSMPVAGVQNDPIKVEVLA